MKLKYIYKQLDSQIGPIGQAALGLGTSVAGGAINTVLGLALEHHNDQRQLAQQGKLQALQIQGQEQLTDYNMQKQLQLWQQTSYPAQLAMMEKAGLNPALMYGQGGGGGVTANVNTGSVSGAQAPSGGREIMELQQQNQAVQNMLAIAQAENLKAQANKANVEAEKTAGADTELTNTQTASLAQGINNQKSAQALTEIQTELAKVDLGFSKATYDDRIDYIAQEAREMTGKASQALIQANLDTDARNTRLKTIQAEYVQRLLENALITSQTNATNKSINVMDVQMRLDEWKMKEAANNIVNSIEGMSQSERDLMLKRTMTDFDTDPSTEIMRGLSRGLGSIIPIIGRSTSGNTPTPIRGFHQR